MLATAGACVFLDPINVPPSIKIVFPEQVWRGVPATFSADVTDDQSTPPNVEWARTDIPCPMTAGDSMQWPPNRTASMTFTVDGTMTRTPFCVWAVARDRYGAAAAAVMRVDPMNQPPKAALNIISPAGPGPYIFLSQFRFSSSSNDADNDPLTLTWNLALQPPGSTAKLAPCSDAPMMDSVRCLASDMPGAYEIDLTVSDGTDSVIARVTVVVQEDKLPCIVSTLPDYAAGHVVHDKSASEDVFSVLQVADDLDPWPAASSQLHFNWSVAAKGGALVSQGTDASTFHLAASAFQVGDTAEVRVDVADRNNAAEIQQTLAACGQDTCAVTEQQRAFGGQSGCLLRVGWTVEFR